MKFLPLLLLLFYSLPVNSQTPKLNQRYPGYFINAKGDTIRGWILLINKLDNQAGGEYSNDARAEKVRIFLMPDEVRGFIVQDRVYNSIDYGDPDHKSQHFLLTLAEGDLKLYEYFRLSKDLYVGTGAGQRPATGNDEQYLQNEFIIVNKAGKQFTIENENSLAKNAEEIFASDAALMKKVKEREKEFRFKDLPELVKQYNDAVK